jgi:spore germination protein KB
MEKIGAKETSFLFAILIISTVTLGAISGFAEDFGTLAYVNSAICTALSFLLVWISKRSLGNSNFYTVVYSAYGQTAGKIFMCLVFILTVLNASLRMGVFTDAIGSMVLPQTPRFIIFAVMAICSFFVSYFGFEAITRYALVCFTVFLAFFAVILFSSLSEAEVANLKPQGVNGEIVSVISMLFVFSDIFYVYLISDKIKGKNSALHAVFIGGGIAILLTLFYVMCVPYPVLGKYSYPFYTLASLTNSSLIFQRMDGLVFVVWIFASFVSSGALCLFASDILARVFCLSDRKVLSAPVSLMMFLTSYLGFAGQWVSGAMSFVCFVFLPATAIIFKCKEAKNCEKQ